MNRYGTFKIFFEHDFDSYSRGRLEELRQTIRNEDETFIVNVDESKYIEHLVSKYSIDPLELHFDHIEVSVHEEMIPAEHFPFDFNVYEGKSYPKPVIKYHLPVTGDLGLLRCIPNPRVLMTYPVSLENGAVCFDIVDFYNDADRIKREADSRLGTIRQQYENLASNIRAFNAGLQKEARNLFGTRKEELLKRSHTLSKLGVPIRKASGIPSTFAVPAARKQIVSKPAPSGSPAKSPDPTLEENIYQDILKVIHDTGKVFERLPRTYAGKDEESLRDHLILQLEPQFEYSTTGETFNKTGKTDILIRYEKSNIFVAECKFWGGSKKHLETIDQILSYLTWRDSKTAIVYFMDTKEMSAPLKAIEVDTPGHLCFVKLNGKKDDSWFDYTFHLPGDKGVPIRLSILCFHLPKSSK
ncbi:MAG: hypothetical protein ROO76_07170 [Terriglobia bacterium]|nr:hypothetical protein [Terriglobia bacterium]